MNPIQNITDYPNQTFNVPLADGTQFTMTIYYSAQQYGWFIINLTYNDFEINGLRITNSPNFLHQFRNQIPFGLACYTAGSREPTQLEDFNTGAAQLFLLPQSDVEAYNAFLTGES